MSYNETTKFCTADDVLAEDWYEILGCNPNSKQSEIDEAYRHLAKLYHPDRNKDKEAINKFYLINSAYQILGDREIRAYYDYESGNINAENTFVFHADEDIIYFKSYVDSITDYEISDGSAPDKLWDHIAANCITNKSDFKRKLNIVGTLEVTKKALDEGLRTAFPVYRYKTCGVCRGFGKIGVEERETCYNCEGYGIEDERIFVYVEIPKKYKPEKLFKVPGRGHKVPAGIGDLIIQVKPTSNLGMKTKIFKSSLKNKRFRGGE